MKNILILILLSLPVCTLAQVYENAFLAIPINETGAAKHMLHLGSTFNVESNALNNTFYNAYLYSDSLSDASKRSGAAHLQDKNSFGGYLQNHAFYAWPSKKEHQYYYVQAASRFQYSASFNKDVYNLVFFGNADYAGRSADLTGFSFNHTSYQSLQFGMYRYLYNSKNRSTVIGGGIALVSGASYTRISIPSGSFYTSPTGDSIALNANMSSKFVNALSNFTDLNGYGLSLNFFLATRLSQKDLLRFHISDLGVVHWFHNNASFDINDKVTYTGENITLNSGDFSSGNYHLEIDTLLQKFLKGTDHNAFNSVLPFQAALWYQHSFNPKNSISAWAEYVNSDMPLPLYGVVYRYSFVPDKFSVSPGISGFGYGAWGVSLGADAHITPSLALSLGTQHLEGLIAAENTHGRGYYATLLWGF